MEKDSRRLILAPPSSPAPSTPARLFLALWPNHEQRTRLVRHRKDWGWPRSTSLVCDERLHLTLHFIGSVDRKRVGEIAAGLVVPLTPFSLRLTHPQIWPNGIAVLSAVTLPEALSDLHNRLACALHALALPVEARRFRPHVTLARRAIGAAPPGVTTDIEWEVDSYTLVESALAVGDGYRVQSTVWAAGFSR